MLSYIYSYLIFTVKKLASVYMCAHTYRHMLYIKYVLRRIYMHHHRHDPQNFNRKCTRESMKNHK